MEYFNLNLMLFITTMIPVMQLPGTMAQTRHIVGGSLGWTIPSGGAVSYTTWASHQSFTVNDLLVFNFTDGEYDVAEVSEAAYGPCTATNPISLATNGPATLTLTTAGTHYYICTFRSHCQIGQKLTIDVSEAASSIPPGATPVTPPTIRRPPRPVTSRTAVETPNTATPFAPCPRITSAPPPPTDGAPSFTGMVPSTFLIIGLVFLNC
ncbi:umecyanin [Lactuca sativa]|uniref:umecyanin n=1 Tax=Lactuca sativa TaxID=4236 RepID=UPI000CD92B5A|nr:umecyanin [Lactuca sativa]